MAGVSGIGQVTTANTARDGSGAIVDIIGTGSETRYIQRVEAKATSTTTAGMIRLFKHDGSAYRLWQELIVTAITVGAAVESWEDSYNPSPPFPILAGEKLGASTHNTETFNIFAIGI